MQGLRRRMVLDLSSSRMVSGEVTRFIDLYTEYYIFLKVLFSLVLCGYASKAAFKCRREEKRGESGVWRGKIPHWLCLHMTGCTSQRASPIKPHTCKANVHKITHTQRQRATWSSRRLQAALTAHSVSAAECGSLFFSCWQTETRSEKKTKQTIV